MEKYSLRYLRQLETAMTYDLDYVRSQAYYILGSVQRGATFETGGEDVLQRILNAPAPQPKPRPPGLVG